MFSARLGFMRPDSVPQGIPWTPNDITSATMLAWFDATDSSDYVTEADRVPELLDKSGNNVKMVMNQLTRQATITQNNGIDGLLFDGVDDYYTGISNGSNIPNLPFNNSYAMFSVQSVVAKSATQQWMCISHISNETHASMFANGNNQFGSVRRPNSGGSTPFSKVHDTPMTEEWHLTYYRYAGADLGSDLWDSVLDGGVYVNFNKPLSTPDIMNRMSIGCLNKNVQQNFTEMTWNKSLLFDKPLSLAEQQKLEGWSAHQLGLTDNLPADHPYKTSAPEK